MFFHEVCGFEIGDLSQCDSIAGTPTAISSGFTGTYCAQLTDIGDKLHWDTGFNTDCTCTCWANVQESNADLRILDIIRNSKHIYFRVYETSGNWYFELNVDGTATSKLIGTFRTGVWQYFNLIITSTYAKIAWNGIETILTQNHTITGNITALEILNNSAANVLVDDVCIAQSVGMMAPRIVPLRPDEDEVTGLSATGSPHYAEVRDVPPGDSTYVYASATNYDLYHCRLPQTPTGWSINLVRAISVVFRHYQATSNPDSRTVVIYQT